MANLRDLIDGKAIDAEAKDDVFKHLRNVHRAKGDYETAKAMLHSKLAPTRALLEHVDREHPNAAPPQGNMDNPNDPNNPQQGGVAQNDPRSNGVGPQAPKPGNSNVENRKGPAGRSQDMKDKLAQKRGSAFPKGNKTSTKDKLAKGQRQVRVSVNAGGPGSGRHPYSVQVQYKGGVNNAGREGYRYTQKDIDDRKIPKHENRIARIIEKHGGNHEKKGVGHIFNNQVYHKATFSDEKSARAAHAEFKNKGYKYGLEIQHNGVPLD